MAQLTTKKRKSLKSSQFAGPDRSYPVNDRSHAANAKARASQAVKAGRMSKSEESRIDAKANRVLGRGKGHESHERSEHGAKTRHGTEKPMLKHTGAKEREHKGREHLGVKKMHEHEGHRGHKKEEHKREPKREAKAHERAGEKRHMEHKKEGREHERKGMERHERKEHEGHKKEGERHLHIHHWHHTK